MKDIIVIGAGPVGSYTAYQLAKSGFDIAVLEEHPIPGVPTSCTGVIGIQAFERFDLPKNTILNTLKDIQFISPYGDSYIYRPSVPQAFVVDRGRFDYEIMKQAIALGVDYMLSTRALNISIKDAFVEIEIKSFGEKDKLRAKIVFIATGYNYSLTKKLGLGEPLDHLNGAQAEVETRNIEETEVYLGNNIAPGSFAWAVPLGNDRTRIGLTVKNNAAMYLRALLKREAFTNRIKEKRPKIVLDNIALGAIPKSYASRVIVVGEAAGQVKSTTSGGVLYGLECSLIAIEIVKKAFKKNNFGENVLSEYERKWKKKFGFEINIGYYFRKIMEDLSDEQIEVLFQSSKKIDLMNLLKKKLQFDKHRDLILFILNNPTHRKIIWQGLWQAVGFKK